MDRRRFLGLSAAACGGLWGPSAAVVRAATGDLDRFGGWTQKRFAATGFFRVERDDRWWLVTPEGNAFLSFGINHLHPHLWAQPFNATAWRQRLGVSDLRGPEFRSALRTWFMHERGEFGFNTLGVHTALPAMNTPEPFMPYMLPIHFVDIPHWREDVADTDFVDVFSAEFVQHCDRLAQELAAPAKDDPFLLGYTMTDCPLLTEEDCRERPDVIGGAARAARIGWPRRLRNFGPDSSGKQAYVATVRALYRDDIADFNATYGTAFDSFDALAAARDWRPHTDLSNGSETRDNVEFLKRVVAQYYQSARDAIRRYDRNHLFMGDKLNANTDTVDTVLPVTSRFTDVVLYQMYARYDVQQPGLDRWSKIADQPFLNGDSSFTVTTDTMPRPYGPVADDQQQRADWTREFFESAFARPDFVGWHYCGLIDSPNLIASKIARQHSGLLNVNGEPYPEVRDVLKACADEMYAIATSRA
ncbi:MAG: hypothetical protein AB7U20_12735 [Planctomycetaceae bacterium]